MKALVKSKAEPGIWLEHVDEPTINAHQVLIKIKSDSVTSFAGINPIFSKMLATNSESYLFI